MIYFVRAVGGGAVKIGYTCELCVRLPQLEAHYGRRLEVLATMPGGRDDEARIHGRFAHLRFGSTEQFRPTPELMEFMGCPTMLDPDFESVTAMLSFEPFARGDGPTTEDHWWMDATIHFEFDLPGRLDRHVASCREALAGLQDRQDEAHREFYRYRALVKQLADDVARASEILDVWRLRRQRWGVPDEVPASPGDARPRPPLPPTMTTVKPPSAPNRAEVVPVDEARPVTPTGRKLTRRELRTRDWLLQREALKELFSDAVSGPPGVDGPASHGETRDPGRPRRIVVDGETWRPYPLRKRPMYGPLDRNQQRYQDYCDRYDREHLTEPTSADATVDATDVRCSCKEEGASDDAS